MSDSIKKPTTFNFRFFFGLVIYYFDSFQIFISMTWNSFSIPHYFNFLIFENFFLHSFGSTKHIPSHQHNYLTSKVCQIHRFLTCYISSSYYYYFLITINWQSSITHCTCRNSTLPKLVFSWNSKSFRCSSSSYNYSFCQNFFISCIKMKRLRRKIYTINRFHKNFCSLIFTLLFHLSH